MKCLVNAQFDPKSICQKIHSKGIKIIVCGPKEDKNTLTTHNDKLFPF